MGNIEYQKWHVSDDGFDIYNEDGWHIATVRYSHKFEEKTIKNNAKHIVDCVNACAGVSFCGNGDFTGAMQEDNDLIASLSEKIVMLTNENNELKKKYSKVLFTLITLCLE